MPFIGAERTGRAQCAVRSSGHVDVRPHRARDTARRIRGSWDRIESPRRTCQAVGGGRLHAVRAIGSGDAGVFDAPNAKRADRTHRLGVKAGPCCEGPVAEAGYGVEPACYAERCLLIQRAEEVRVRARDGSSAWTCEAARAGNLKQWKKYTMFVVYRSRHPCTHAFPRLHKLCYPQWRYARCSGPRQTRQCCHLV